MNGLQEKALTKPFTRPPLLHHKIFIMTNKLIRHLQEYLGAHIEKINPNTQAVDDSVPHHRYDLLAQAAVPAVLAAFYKFTRMENGVKEIVADNGKQPPLDYLLGNNKMEVVKRIADYATVPEDQAENIMDAVADECLRFVKNELGSTYSPENLQYYFADNRQTILGHLPADLKMGECSMILPSMIAPIKWKGPFPDWHNPFKTCSHLRVSIKNSAGIQRAANVRL
jgi:hypothetical protein